MDTYDLKWIIFDDPNISGGIWAKINKIEIDIRGKVYLTHIDMSILNKRLKIIGEKMDGYIDIPLCNIRLSFKLREFI